MNRNRLADRAGDIVADTKTIKAIVSELRDGSSVLIGWTDGYGNHYDLLFVYRPQQYGPIQDGITAQQHLFVSVLGRGAFAFMASTEWFHESYYGATLGIDTAPPDTIVSIARLIGWIRYMLARPGE